MDFDHDGKGDVLLILFAVNDKGIGGGKDASLLQRAGLYLIICMVL
jgi:hypothetical protein